MLALALGVIIGVAIELGPATFVTSWVSALLRELVLFSDRFVLVVAGWFGPSVASSKAAAVIALVLGIAGPGLLLLFFSVLTRTLVRSRRLLASAAVVLLVSLAVLTPTWQATFAVLGLAFVVAVFAGAIEALGISAMTSIVVALGTAYAVLLCTPHSRRVITAADRLAGYSALHVSGLWYVGLLAAGCVPLVCAASVLLFGVTRDVSDGGDAAQGGKASALGATTKSAGAQGEV